MKITILTLFPEMFSGPFDQSIIKRAKVKHILDIHLVNIRAFAADRYKSVDDHPYGGGHGMIMRVDVIDKAVSSVKNQVSRKKTRIILLDPQGTPYTQKKAHQFSKFDHLILLSGHYEGVDERVRSVVDEEISIGDYVLTGGEIPSMVVVDSVVRLLPGVLGKDAAFRDESFSPDPARLEYPQYTRPPTYKSMGVPDVLLSGNHTAMGAWRKAQATVKTKKRRPDLLKPASR